MKIGYRSYIGVDKNNVIVYGHKRYFALKLINPGMTIPVNDLSDLDEINIKKNVALQIIQSARTILIMIYFNKK